MDNIILTEDLVFEEEHGSLIKFPKGSLGKQLNGDELEDIIKSLSIEKGAPLMKEFEFQENDRKQIALINGFLCMLNRSEFGILDNVPKVFSMNYLKQEA